MQARIEYKVCQFGAKPNRKTRLDNQVLDLWRKVPYDLITTKKNLFKRHLSPICMYLGEKTVHMEFKDLEVDDLHFPIISRL